jgi:hypothetical protein
LIERENIETHIGGVLTGDAPDARRDVAGLSPVSRRAARIALAAVGHRPARANSAARRQHRDREGAERLATEEAGRGTGHRITHSQTAIIRQNSAPAVMVAPMRSYRFIVSP